MTDELVLPTPAPRPDTDRTTRPATPDETNLLAQVGRKMQPEGSLYRGSVCVHLYERDLAADFLILAQTSITPKRIPEAVALQASKELGRQLMQIYGHKPPARLDDKPDTEL